MNAAESYKDFTTRLRLLISKQPGLITTTLGNIFTLRLVGNKTHGDLAEIAIAEFVNQFMYDFRSVHVGKDLFRAKSQEEDIKTINEITKDEFPVSLKAYGIGPLQLSTDKDNCMFPRLAQEDGDIVGTDNVRRILNEPAFADFSNVNVLPLIYDEKDRRCNIMVFDYLRARDATVRIAREGPGGKRKHPVYRFYDAESGYICEVRYGDAAANALQRGLWTHTGKGIKFFDSITNGWIDYAHNHVLVDLFSHALVSSAAGHATALEKVKEDINRLKRQAGFSP